MSSDLVFIIGRQRSGTTVVRDLFVRNGAFNADEVMHGDLSRPHRFYAFVRDCIQDDPSLVHPERHAALWDRYIADLRTKADGRKIAIDLKYFGLNLIPARGDMDARRPYILRFIKRSGSHVLHIVRQNKLRVHVSELLAKSTGKWSARKVGDLPAERERLTLDLDDTVKTLNVLDREVDIAEKLLSFLPDRRNIVYESMFKANGNFADHVIHHVEEIMGRSEIDPVPGNIRLNPQPLSELVANYDELAARLKDMRFAWMLEGN